VTGAGGQKVDSEISYGGTVTVEHDARVTGDVVPSRDVVLEENARSMATRCLSAAPSPRLRRAGEKGEEVSFGGRAWVDDGDQGDSGRPPRRSHVKKEGSGGGALLRRVRDALGLGVLVDDVCS